MTNPLTPEQIELLRSLAEKPRLVIEDSDYFYGADYLNVCGYVDIADAPDGGFQYVVSYAGKVLLATIDAERERVLTRVSDELRSWERRDLDKGREAAAWGFQDFRDWVDAQRGATDV